MKDKRIFKEAELESKNEIKFNYCDQFYFLIMKHYNEEGTKLTSSDVMNSLEDNRKIWESNNKYTDDKKDFRATVSGHLSDLKEQNILCYDEKIRKSNLYYINPEVNIDEYLKDKASKILEILDVDIQNIYDESPVIFDYLDIDKTILTHSQICDLVNTYGRRLIYGA